jgi:hypothetical protein
MWHVWSCYYLDRRQSICVSSPNKTRDPGADAGDGSSSSWRGRARQRGEGEHTSDGRRLFVGTPIPRRLPHFNPFLDVSPRKRIPAEGLFWQSLRKSADKTHSISVFWVSGRV